MSVLFSLHYEPAGSSSIGHSLLCRCTRQSREEGGSVPTSSPGLLSLPALVGGEGDAGMRLSGSRLQPAAAAKDDKQIRGERVRNRQKGEVEKK